MDKALLKERVNLISLKLKAFFESIWFMILLGIITVITWKLDCVFLPFCILCAFIALIALCKANAISAISLFMLYYAGNRMTTFAGKSIAGFIILGIFILIAVVATAFRVIPNVKQYLNAIGKNDIIRALLIMVTVMILSVVKSPIKGHSFGLAIVFCSNILLALVALFGYDGSKETNNKLAFAMIIFGFVIFIEEIFRANEHPFNLSFIETIKVKETKLGWDHPNHVATVGCISVMMSVFLFFNSDKLGYKLFSVLSAVICVLAVLMTTSRGAALGFALSSPVLVYMLYLKYKNKAVKWLVITTWIFMAIGGIAIFIVLLKTDNLEKIVDDNGRNGIWKVAIDNFKNNPILGTGWGTSHYYIAKTNEWWSFAVNYHNYILQASTCGIIGIGAFIYYLVILFKNILKRNLYSILMLAVVVLFLGQGFVDTTFYSMMIMPLLSMLVMQVSKKNNNETIEDSQIEEIDSK